MTADKIYQEILELPVKERVKLFAAIARHGFEKDLYTHQEVFEDLRQQPFTIKEAADYLEVAEITVRRWVKKERLRAMKIGQNIVFDVEELKRFKKDLEVIQ
ncbi:MAG: helix-turn-helix domain-containing protein [Candidatus Tectomicrobia bacterium]|uniref:Helix-turn-helix domain-containing protein n=1 Tax=Tectimicrobiota bacterium TaxID=2528274 RepID=A0A933GMC7_UNCTE|nr:helix-turn-helix domain-containing protein [Candidatus Tectomicrobia bacterium]